VRPVNPLPEFDAPEGALGPYLRALRAHWLIASLIVLVAVAGAVAFVVRRTPEYHADAQLLVSPLEQANEAFLGLPFVRDSGDPTRTVQTAATLVDSQGAAAVAAGRLGPGWTTTRVEHATTVQPVGQSNVLQVQATADRAPLAARVANTYAQSIITFRRSDLKRLVAVRIASAQAELNAIADKQSPEALQIADRLSQLRTVADGSDPTISISQQATVPTGSANTPAWLIILLAALGGVVVAGGAALVLQSVSQPKLQDDAALLELYPLPVLARVPVIRRRQQRSVEGGVIVSPLVREAFRSLQVQLELQPGEHQTIMLTSASAADGKTTSVVNFGYELAASGREVILLDLDVRKPDLGRAVGVGEDHRMDVLLGATASLHSALVPVPGASNLRVLPAARATDLPTADRMAQRLPQLLREARGLADYVLIDTAPLGEVSDALRFIPHVDDLFLVARLGNTREASFEQMRDLLARTTKEPTGYVIIGSSKRPASSYYYYGANGGAAPSPEPAEPAAEPSS
jgi:Mrp family chromosome partitioning ATPase